MHMSQKLCPLTIHVCTGTEIAKPIITDHLHHSTIPPPLRRGCRTGCHDISHERQLERIEELLSQMREEQIKTRVPPHWLWDRVNSRQVVGVSSVITIGMFMSMQAEWSRKMVKGIYPVMVGHLSTITADIHERVISCVDHVMMNSALCKLDKTSCFFIMFPPVASACCGALAFLGARMGKTVLLRGIREITGKEETRTSTYAANSSTSVADIVSTKGYYKCSSMRGCPARKHVERCLEDSSMLIVTYKGEHNHPKLPNT